MEEDHMPDTVPELQALVLALRGQLADLRQELSQQKPPTTTASTPSTTTPQRITSSSSANKITMSSLFSRKRGSDTTPPPTSDPVPTPSAPSAPSARPKDADSRRLAELQRVLDEDDIAELRKPMEHPLAAAARRKHLMLNTGAGTVSSLGFGGVTAPKVYPTGGGDGRGVSEEEEVLSLVKQVVEDVSVESRREKLDNDDDELLEAKLRRLQGKK